MKFSPTAAAKVVGAAEVYPRSLHIIDKCINFYFLRLILRFRLKKGLKIMAMVLPSGVIQAEDRGVIYSITWFSPPANYEKKGSK